SLERLIAGIDELLSEDQSDSTRIGAAALTAMRTQLLGELDRLSSLPTTAIAAGAGDGESTGEAEPPGKAQLHATWDASRLVVWSAGRATAPADFDQLSDFLESVDAAPHGWAPHRSVPLPDGARAAALSIELADALGWLVTVARGHAGDGIGPSLRW